jgi:hypothetical protein
MYPSKHVYLNARDVVVQIISGAVDGFAHDALLADYGKLYGATRCVRVEDDRPIWIGGSYDSTSGVFSPPPSPEPEPEPIVEEPINDDAPII